MSDLMVPTKPLNTGDQVDLKKRLKFQLTENFPQDIGWRSSCQRYIGQFLVALLSLLAFLSPIVMVLLPRLLASHVLHILVEKMVLRLIYTFLQNAIPWPKNLPAQV